MHKCINCGQEFDGMFCPNCGTKYSETKICPDCNAELNSAVNFCNHCGHRFDTLENKQNNVYTAQTFEFGEKFYRTVSRILKWLPCVLFLLFAALNFVFMSCKAYSAFGFGMGNIYKISDPDHKIFATAIIVVSAVSAAYALAYPLLVGKMPKVAHSLTFVLYAGMLAVASAFNIKITKDDYTAEIATKLLIAFTVVFATLSAFTLIADRILSKRNAKYMQAKSSVGSGDPTFMQKVAYNLKNSYSKHKKVVNGSIIGVCSVAVVCVLVFVVIIPIATNIFSVRKLSKINLGDSKEQVEKVIGKPYTGKTENNVWTYYSKEILDLYKLQDELNKKVDSITDLEQLGNLMEQQIALDEKINTTTGKYIAISFNNDNCVTSLVYDANYCKYKPSANKEVKSVTVGNNNTVDIVDIANNNVAVSIIYNDGSYQLTALPNVQTSNFGAVAKTFPSSATLTWHDLWGEYSQPVKFDESNYNLDWSCKNGELYIDGTIPTNYLMNLFNMQLPWIDEDVTSIEFGSKVSYIPALSDLVKDASSVTKILVDSGNSNYYNIRLRVSYYEDSNIVVDKTLNKVLFAPANVKITNDNANNTFALCEEYSSIPILILSSSRTDNLLLPYYNNGNYIVHEKLEDKYTSCEFDNGWINIPYFLKNKNYSKITLPNSIVSIDDDAFNGFNSLKAVYITDIDAWYKIDFGTWASNPLYYAHNLYLNGTKVTELNIPETVTEIKAHAFEGWNGTSITIPESLTSISSYAFNHCDSLTGVYITDIDAWYKIDFGTWASNPLYYAHNLYLNGTKVTELNIPDTVTEIKANTFVGWNGTSITIPSSVTSIGNSAFYNCSSLKGVCITDINAWYNIDFGNGISNPLYCAHNFYLNGTLVTELEIPDTVTEIKAYTFAGWNGKSVTIPSNVTSIGNYTFEYCGSLNEIRYNGTVSQWSEIAKDRNWNYDVPATKVICSDGEVAI